MTLSQKLNNHHSTSTSSTIQFVPRTTWIVDSKFYPERESLFIRSRKPKFCKQRYFYNLKLNKKRVFNFIVVVFFNVLFNLASSKISTI